MSQTIPWHKMMKYFIVVTKKPVFLFLSFLLTCTLLQAQEYTVSGKVTSAEDEEGIPGATVVVRGTTTGTITDFDGNFSLKVEPQQVLVISFLGFETQQVLVSGQPTINVSLLPDLQRLDEVVVVGYGTVRKSDLTGAVSSVNIDEAQKIATVDVSRSIQGRVAGVQVTSNSGAPGEGTNIRIRGVGSFANSEPLYVIDGFLTGDASNVDPRDVENIEVLKDASATAIYGSRGANGVIIITTKQGKANKFTVDVNAYAGVQSAWKRQDLLNASEYAQLYLEAEGGPGTTDPSVIADDQLRSWITSALNGEISGTDWQEEVLREALIQSYAVGIRGGSEKLRYKINGSYFDQDGIIKNTYGRRYQVNGRLDYKINDIISITGDVKFNDGNNIVFQNETANSILVNALRKDPINPVRAPNGDWDRTNLTDIPNPARLVEEQLLRVRDVHRLQPGLTLNLDFTKDLKFTSSVFYDWNRQNDDLTTPLNTTVESRNTTDASPGNEFVISTNESTTTKTTLLNNNEKKAWQNTNILSYNKKFKRNSINLILGHEFYSQRDNFLRINSQDDSVTNNFLTIREFTILSFFSRAVYSYDDRYLITATLRRDGSSKFPKSGRWGNFPSFSTGWNVHQESFYPKGAFIESLKLRAGWGIIGNSDAISPFGFNSTLTPNILYSFDGSTVSEGLAPQFFAASGLKWEESETVNIGTDLVLAKGRVTFSADYYIKKTNDLLVDNSNNPVALFVGARAPTSNAASMTNKGLEIALGYNETIGKVDFSIGGNISFVSNEVTSLLSGSGVIPGANQESRIGLPVTRTTPGDEFASFYGRRTAGIFQTDDEVDAYRGYNSSGQPINSIGEVVTEFSDDHVKLQPTAEAGDIIYADVNKDGNIDEEDVVRLGSAIPDFSYGMYFSVDYKNWSLSASFNGIKGNEIANILTFYTAGSSLNENNLVSTRRNRWTLPGSSNTEPRVTNGQNTNSIFSDRFIEDGSFLRLRNVRLGYVIPEGAFKNSKINKLEFYLSADNLLTFTKYSGLDPEVGLSFGNPFTPGVDFGTYPVARTIIFGTNINF